MTDKTADSDALIAKLAAAGLAGTIGQLSSRALQFCFLLGLARYLGPSEYGLFMLGWITVTLLRSVGGLGVDRGIVRLVSGADTEGSAAQARGTIVSALGVAIMAGTAVGGVLVLASDPLAVVVFDKPQFAIVTRTLGAIIPLWTFLLVAAAIAQAFRNIRVQQAVRNARVGLPLLFLGGAVIAGGGLDRVLYAMVLSGVAAAALAAALVYRTVPIQLAGPRTTDIPRLLRISVPLFLSGFIYGLLYRIDQLLLGVFATTAVVGVYNAASVLAAQLSVFLFAIGSIFEPIASDLNAKSANARLRRLFERVTVWAVVVTAPAAALLWAFPDLLLSLFGARFRAGRPFLLVLTLYPLIRIIIGPTGELLQMTGHERVVLADSVVMVVLNIALNLLLIPAYGGLGAAVATAVSVGLVEVVSLYQVYVRFGFHPFNRRQARALVGSAALLAGSLLLTMAKIDLRARLLLMLLALSLYVGFAWQFVLEDTEQHTLCSAIKSPW